MQQFCSSFRLSKCIWESWLVVVFVVCPLGGNVPKDLFHQKRVLFDTFQGSIHLRCYYKNFTIYNIFCMIMNWTFWFDHYWFNLINIDSNEPFFWRRFIFVSHPLGGNVPKDLFWQNRWLLKTLSLKRLKKQTLLILWAARLMETYPKTSVEKIGGFWKL